MRTLLFPGSDESSTLANKYGYDKWLVSRFLEYVPNIKEFLDKMEMQPTQYIRVNTLKTDRLGLENRLRSKGFELKSTVLSEVFAVEKSPFAIGATTEYLLGHYYIQDLSSAMAIEALDVREGQASLDVAAAPGGKTTFIAQKMKNTGLIIALEPNEKRMRSMSFNLARCGVLNTCIFKIDAAYAERKLQMKFDRVLLDAPCSCEGVIAKDIARKKSHLPQDVDYCSNRQEKLIEVATKMVKPGGILVYSTCSFAPEENEMVIDWLLRKFPNLSIEPLPYGNHGLTSFGNLEFDGRLGNTRRLYPHIHDTTGFFIAKISVN